MYTVTIKNTDGEKLYCDPSTDGKTSQYTLSFKASFTMNTLIGMIEIVNGLPITLEEIFLMHYPAEYGHLSASLLSFTEYNEVKQGEKPPFQLAQSSLSLSYAVAQAIKEKNSFISGKIQLYGNIGGGGGDDSNDSTDETSTGNNNTSKKVKAIGNYTKKFIPDIIEKIGSECPEVAKGYQMWKNVTGTANSIKTIYETWTVNKAIFTLIDAQKDLSALQKVYQSVMGANLYSKYGKEVIDHVLENLKSSEIGKLATFSKTNSSAAMDFLLETDGPAEKILEAQKSTFSQIMNYVDLAFSAIDTVAAFSKCWELSASLADEKKKFFHILHSMNTLDIPFGSRGSTATVVKSRIGVDKFAQGVKAQDIKAAWAAFDLVCSVASFTPAAPIAGAIKVIKDTAEATKMLIVNSLDLLESSYPNNMATRAWTQFKDNKTTENEKWSNYQLLGDPDMEKHFPSSADKEKLKDMNAQARILAEAIRGLMSLINHINCPIYKDYTGARKTVDYSEFDKKFNKLKISEYIDRFIYGKGFLMPKNPILSIGLDQIWGYMASDFWSYETTVENITPDRQYIGVIPTNPNADVFNHWKADFHKYFPIHKTENTSHNFAHIFSRNYSGADAQLNYTQIYYRHVTDVNADDAKDKPWLHLSNIADIQNAITTDTQIRILLVFANDIRHVPLKIQLIRIETGFDIAGPEYLVTPGVLKSQKDGGVLLDEEKDFQNKIGAVVYPFYIFANATRYGVRPVDASDGVIGYAKQKFWKGNTEDISNQYEFSVFVGKAKLPVFFGEKPFYYDTGKNITNFNYLMSHNLTSSKFFFHLRRKDRDGKDRITDCSMLSSPAFLNSKSAEAVTAPLMTKYGKLGTSGILLYDNKYNKEYYPEAIWKNNCPKILDKINLAKFDRNSLKATVVIYITMVNEQEFLGDRKNLYSWTALPCKMEISHSTYGLNVKKQINSGTLHFLGHSLNVRNPAGIDFKLRIHHSSVNQITGLLENEISEIDIGESSQLQKDLKELLSWGKSNDNFSKHLYANPHVSGNSESSFFAANIDLSYYDNDFKMQKGLDTKFEKGHEIAFQLNIPGISSVPQSERVYVV